MPKRRKRLTVVLGVTGAAAVAALPYIEAKVPEPVFVALTAASHVIQLAASALFLSQ